MANEITSTYSLSAAKNNVALSQSGTNRITMAGSVIGGGVVSVATTAAGVAVSIGTVGTPGVSVFKNLDTSNYLELGVQVAATFYPFVKLKPGEQYVWRLGTTTPFGRANVAACLMQYTIIED